MIWPAARAARTATLTAGLGMLVPLGGLRKNDARVTTAQRTRRVADRPRADQRAIRRTRSTNDSWPMNDLPFDAFARVRFVLVNTSHPGNIGAAARAIRTMGLRRLSLVAPQAFPHREATALAAGADDVLDAAPVNADLPAAIADCRLVLGATARRRGVELEELDPREAARRVLAAAGEGHEVALLFGNERVGLDNDEIRYCHAAITIPSDPSYSSLN